MIGKYAVSIAAIVIATTSANAGKFDLVLNNVIAGPITEVVASDAVIQLVEKQNTETGAFDQNKIDELDQLWRAERDSSAKPFIDEVMGRPLSNYLKSVQSQSGGVLTEIFVVDAKGLNVGQSAETSDYWQGDEDKWQIPFNSGGVDIGDVGLDESTQMVQAQISVPVKNSQGDIIGTATFGVSVNQ